MPTKVEKDAITGTETTGHEWDGIKELNTPLPKWWVYVFYATILFSLVYVILFPAIPGLSGYTRGLLGYDQREAFEESLAAAREHQAVWLDRMETASLQQIIDEPELQAFALAGGQAAFAENCVACHGLGGAGQAHYPTLADDEWLWGGTLDDIHATLLYGIRSEHPQTRLSVMPRYGADGILSREEIADVAHHVLSLSGRSDDAEAAARGEEIYAFQCVACHGEAGGGLREFGGPNLTDEIWLYGGTLPEVIAQIANPRHGVMPAWEQRLDPNTINMLTVYVHALGGGE